METLEVKNLHKSYGDTHVLRGVDFYVFNGEIVAIIGGSGSGKTTLLKCLDFLVIPDEGTISIDGEILFDSEKRERFTEKRLRKKRLHFGFVFQHFNLFPQYTVLKNVAIGPLLLRRERLLERRAILKRQWEEERKALRERLHKECGGDSLAYREKYKTGLFELKEKYGAELVENREKLKSNKEKNIEDAKKILVRVGLTEKMELRPDSLSGGQRQRVAIARALALKPDIICFDEPTSALDPELKGEVLKLIRDLRDEKTSMIVVTHEMEFARNVADRVIFLADGKVEESGTPEKIFEYPTSEKTRAFVKRNLEIL